MGRWSRRRKREETRIGSTLINAHQAESCCEGCVLAWCLRKEVCCFFPLNMYLFVICFAFCKISFCFCKHTPALFYHWLQQEDSFLYCLWKYIIFFRCFNELGHIKGSEKSELEKTPLPHGIPCRAG